MISNNAIIGSQLNFGQRTRGSKDWRQKHFDDGLGAILEPTWVTHDIMVVLNYGPILSGPLGQKNVSTAWWDALAILSYPASQKVSGNVISSKKGAKSKVFGRDWVMYPEAGYLQDLVLQCAYFLVAICCAIRKHKKKLNNLWRRPIMTCQETDDLIGRPCGILLRNSRALPIRPNAESLFMLDMLQFQVGQCGPSS